MATVLETLIVRLQTDSTRFIAGMAGATTSLDAFSRKAVIAGAGLTAGLTLPLALMGGGAVRAFASFDEAMTRSTAIMVDLSDSMRSQLEQTALALSATTVTSATEAAEAYFFLASAGFSAEEAKNLQFRSYLMIALRKYILNMGWSQKEAAEKLQVTQPRISNLIHGKIDLFSVGMLITMLEKAGFKIYEKIEKNIEQEFIANNWVHQIGVEQ